MWKKPWIGSASNCAVSYATGRPYSLLNQMLRGRSRGYLTFNECRKSGGYVRKGERAHMVVFWKWIPVDDEEQGAEKNLSPALLQCVPHQPARRRCRKGELDPMTKVFLQMPGVFAELELSMIRARVKSGMAAAAAKGKKIGRKPTMRDDIPAAFYKHYPMFVAGKLNVAELARVCGMSRATVYKYLKLIPL